MTRSAGNFSRGILWNNPILINLAKSTQFELQFYALIGLLSGGNYLILIVGDAFSL